LEGEPLGDPAWIYREVTGNAEGPRSFFTCLGWARFHPQHPFLLPWKNSWVVASGFVKFSPFLDKTVPGNDRANEVQR
jgi:hypothetical protein